MSRNVLILGGTGRFGQAVSQAFSNAGWQVKHFNRRTDDLMLAAQGMDVIVAGWNPAYPDWAKQVPALHGRVIEAAQETGATVIVPGNVYVYGPGHGETWSEATPHGAKNPLGRIRIDMEQSYRESGVQTIVLRAGDFIDTRASGNWFDLIMAKNISKNVFSHPGDVDIPHAWAFLPDLSRAAVSLAECRSELAKFEDVPFPGYTLSGTEIAAHLSKLTGRNIRLKRVNWLPFKLLSPFWGMARCLLEMRYLWNTPHQLDGEKFARLVPDFVPTPVPQALASAIVELDQSSAGYISKSTQISA